MLSDQVAGATVVVTPITVVKRTSILGLAGAPGWTDRTARLRSVPSASGASGGPAVIEQTIAKGTSTSGQFPGRLDELLHDDVVFYSPIVTAPGGQGVTKLYLQAAGRTLPGRSPISRRNAERRHERRSATRSRCCQATHAVLEFETSVEGKYVNGVDIIRCDDEGRIVEIRVMIRPLQAINLVHRQMGPRSSR
jgi:hypothetical protein